MSYGIWTVVLATGIACGAALVGLLVVRRAFEPLLVLTALACMTANTLAIVGTAAFYGSPGVAIVVGIASLAAAGGGYGVASALLPMILVRPPASLSPFETSPASERETAILLLGCLEPERYSPGRVAKELAGLAEAGLTEAGLILSPFLYAAQKARYKAMGGTSPATATARRLAVRIGELLAHEARTARVELVDCSAHDSLALKVGDLAAKGYARFIAVGLSVGEPYDLDRSKSVLDTLRPNSAGLRVAYTAPLWGSERLAGEIARRILAGVTDPANTGVALVMHGQPESHQCSHPSFEVQEDAFCNRIRVLVAERGVSEGSVRLCYHDWQSPDASETVRHLAAIGCKHVVVAPACFPLGDAATILDLPVAVNQARVDEHITTTVLPAWGDEPLIAEVIRDYVLETSAEIEAGD